MLALSLATWLLMCRPRIQLRLVLPRRTREVYVFCSCCISSASPAHQDDARRDEGRYRLGWGCGRASEVRRSYRSEGRQHQRRVDGRVSNQYISRAP